MRERTRRAKVRKTCNSIQRRFNKWRKEEKETKNQAMQRQSLTASHSRPMQGQSLNNSYCGKTTPQLLLQRMILYGMEYLSGQFGSALPAMPPPKFLTAPTLLLGQVEWETGNLTPWSTVRLYPKHWGVINTGLVKNSKHSMTWAALKKINSTPVQVFS